MDKEQLFKTCQQIVADKITEIKSSIDSTRASSQNDTKSSMGDKYETTREMLQQELNMLEKQLADAYQQEFNLKNVNYHKLFSVIELGSYIETSIGCFFITISLGEINTPTSKVHVISPVSPLGKLLKGKKAGDSVNMNNKEIKILKVI